MAGDSSSSFIGAGADCIRNASSEGSIKPSMFWSLGMGRVISIQALDQIELAALSRL